MTSSSLATVLQNLRRLAETTDDRRQTDQHLLERFLASKDESAFAILVRRHGRLVLSACRRVLVEEADVEDAFQATFLVLLRKASSVRWQASIGNWLFSVAHRVAVQARANVLRRRRREAEASRERPRMPGEPVDLSWCDAVRLLHEELDRLPDRYRLPLLLCYLDGKTRDEAARILACSVGSIKGRLERGREMLRSRLIRRGLTLSGALLAALVDSPSATSAPPPSLIRATLQAAITREYRGPIAALIQAAAPALFTSKVRITAGLLLSVSLLTVGVGVPSFLARKASSTAELPSVRPIQRAKPNPAPAKSAAEAMAITVRGRVLDPDGKPVRGAKIVFTYGVSKNVPHKVWAISSAAGRFAFTMPVKAVNEGDSEKPKKEIYVVATAEGYGFAATRLDEPGATDLTLRLVQDDVPIRGRIIDLQGKPIAGVRVRIENNILGISKKGDLTEWLAALKASKENHENAKWWDYWTWLYSPAFDLLFPPVTTGADGRFEMKGIGRERMAQLRIEGPTVATQKIKVMTRAIEKIQLPENREFPKGPIATYYGADFELLAAPSRPIVGVVRDKDTGKPLAGVTVETPRIYNQSGFLKTTTDKDGRYRLEGLPKGDGNQIAARADDWSVLPGKERSNQLPYLAAVKRVGNPLGLEPITIDFALKRGVWVKGHVTEKTTGKPLQARVEYFCFNDNPNVKEIALVGSGYNDRFSREDGVFQIPVLPGHGLIAVRAHQDRYVMGVGADKIKGPRDRDQSDVFITTPYICFSGNFHSLVEIDPKAGEESITCDVILDPGRSLKGKVLGPDGKPLDGARIAGLKDMVYFEENTGTDFTVESLKPNKPRLLLFVHDRQKLSGYLVLNGDEKDSFQVRLKPWGTLTGRLLTPLGSPLPSVRVNCWSQVKRNGQVLRSAALVVQPGKDGRFRIEGLIDGLKYKLSVTRSNVVQEISGGNPKEVTFKEGETKDLGDLTVKPME